MMLSEAQLSVTPASSSADDIDLAGSTVAIIQKLVRAPVESFDTNLLLATMKLLSLTALFVMKLVF